VVEQQLISWNLSYTKDLTKQTFGCILTMMPSEKMLELLYLGFTEPQEDEVEDEDIDIEEEG